MTVNKNCKEIPIKSVTEKSKVKFKDDIGCTPNNDLPVKIPLCDDRKTNESVQLSTCPGKDKKEQNSVPNIVKKTNDIFVEVLTNSYSSISNIETQQKCMLHLSLWKNGNVRKKKSLLMLNLKKQNKVQSMKAMGKNGKNGKFAWNLREKFVHYWLPSL